MNLGEFVKSEGAKNIADKVGVSEQTVYEWVKLSRCPRPDNSMKLILISHGRLDWESIYMPFAQAALHGTCFTMKSGSFSSKVSFDFKKELKALGHTVK